ncbi:MAG: acyl carrier protein [Synergistota bacterium]|nr:acyl carrier protein [Synergistota bacterium]
MNMEEKIILLAKTLQLDRKHLNPDTKLDSLEEWDSLGIMAVIAMLDKKFDIRLKGNELALLQTSNDILKHMEEK